MERLELLLEPEPELEKHRDCCVCRIRGRTNSLDVATACVRAVRTSEECSLGESEPLPLLPYPPTTARSRSCKAPWRRSAPQTIVGGQCEQRGVGERGCLSSPFGRIKWSCCCLVRCCFPKFNLAGEAAERYEAGEEKTGRR